jgi:nitroreductase
MELKQVIGNRRAIKKFDTEYQISDSDFKNLLTDSLKAPSSFNIQHWRFVDVVDKDSRQKIRQAAWDQAQVTDASKLIVLCADIKAWEKDPEQYWAQAPKQVQDTIVPMIKNFYEGREWIQRDEALRSVGIIAESFMLNATAMGLDTCPMIGFDQDTVGEIINLPKDHLIGMMISLGKRSEEPAPDGVRIGTDKALILNKF